MNILALTPMYVTPQVEGIKFDSRAVHDLLAPLAENNNIVVIFLYQHPFHEIRKYYSREWTTRRQSGIEYYSDGIRVILCEILKLPKQHTARLTKSQIRLVRQTINNLLAEEFLPDVIVAHMPMLFAPVIEAASLRNIKKVGILHATDQLYAEFKGFRKTDLKSFDAIYARNLGLSRYFAERGCSVVKKGIAYSGVAVESYASAVDRIGARKYAAMYAGKLISRKNVNLIIEAFALVHKHDSARLLIVGEGPERATLQKIAMQYLGRDRCVFTGSVSRDRVLRFMSQSDVFVMPSVNETLGLVYLEAMSQGCIPVGTSGEGIDGIIVNDENGFLVEPTVECLAGTMARIGAMPADRVFRVSSKAIETARTHNCRAASENYRNLLAECL